MTQPSPDTCERLLGAAAALFAERGFQGTTLRDIATRGNVNVAAGHYYFGSKDALYLAVLRAQFAKIRSRLSALGALPSPADLKVLSRPRLERILRLRTHAMLDFLLGPPPSLHGSLMQREMTDPSEALPVIVDEFVVPMMTDLRNVLQALERGLDENSAELCAWSIIGQVLFYRSALPALLHARGWEQYPQGFTDRLADHITGFSLGGLSRLGGMRRKRKHAR